MKTAIIGNDIGHLDELIDFLPGEKILIGKDEIKDMKTEEYNLLVFPGSMDETTVLQNPELYRQEIELVKRFEGAVLGICLGAEIITAAFEGETVELEESERGDVEITLFDSETLTPVRMMVQEAYRVGIIEVPSEFEICGYSEQYPEIIKHEDKPIIGLLFHPEIMYDDVFTVWLFKNLLIRNR
jgi:GMP synthase-like glutamine amidotransferase